MGAKKPGNAGGGGAAPTHHRPGFQERVIAGGLLGSLLYTWVAGVLVVPAALYLALAHADYRLACFVAAYYLFRTLFPAKESPFVRRIFTNGAKYFDHQEVVFDGFTEIPANSRALICFHPHGILTIGWALTSTDPKLSHAKIKWLATDALLRLPFISDFLSWNACAMATKEYMNARMAKGANLALLPGGFEEATLYKRGKFRVYIRKRAGFLAYALRHGYRLHPTFNFGEERTYFTLGLDALTDFCLWLNSYKLPTVCFVGKLGLMPSPDQHLVTVIGPPLQLPRIDKPTPADVEKYHQLYCKALLTLFDKHKANYGAADAQLELY